MVSMCSSRQSLRGNSAVPATPDNTLDSCCYHILVKQLISRIDDDLHRRLKERAAQEGRSVNDLVAETLAAAVMDGRESFGRRLKLSGLRVLPPAPMQPPPSLDDVLDANRGSGTVVSDALQAERNAR